MWHQLGAKKKYIHMSHRHMVWKPSLALAQCIIQTVHRNSKSKYIYCMLYTTHYQMPSSIRDEHVPRWMQWWITWSDTRGDVEGSDLVFFSAAIYGVKIDILTFQGSMPKGSIPTPGLGIWTKVSPEIWPLGMGTDLTSRGTQGVEKPWLGLW